MITIRTGKGEATIDTAEMRDGSIESSRLLTFPDGRTRLMTLPNILWTKADLLQTERGWPSHALAEMVWDSHHSAPEDIRIADLEEGLRFWLRMQLKVAKYGPIADVDEDLPQSER